MQDPLGTRVELLGPTPGTSMTPRTVLLDRDGATITPRTAEPPPSGSLTAGGHLTEVGTLR